MALQTVVASRTGKAQRDDRNRERELDLDSGAEIITNLKPSMAVILTPNLS